MRLLLVPAALALGEACGFAWFQFGAAWPLVAFLALFAAFLCHGLAVRGWPVVVVFLVGVALALRTSDARCRLLRDATASGRAFEAALPVDSEPSVRGGGTNTWVSFNSSLSGVDLRVVLRNEPGEPLPEVGEVWRCAGWLQRKDYGDYTRRNLWVTGRGAYARRDPSARASRLKSSLERLRRDLSRRLGIGIDGTGYDDIADLNRAILLGGRSSIPGATRRLFADAGTIHVFAISGLHVMIIARVLMLALMLAFVPLRVAGVVLLPFLWCYVLMSGASPSALRAAAMSSIYVIAPVAWRRPDALAAWSATFVLFHVVAPESLVKVGSLLSFSVMLGIVLFLRWAEAFNSRLLPAVGVGVAAWAAGAPIVACVFGHCSPGGILANLVLVSAAEVSIGAGVLGVLASFVSTTLAAHLNFAAALVTKGMVGVSWAVAHLPGAHFDTRRWTLVECAAWYAVLGLSLWLVRSVVLRRRRSI